jgi:acyl carrier protein
MNRTDALTALRDAAVTVLSLAPDQVVETASFADDLDADSLDLVELVMALEDALNIEIGDRDLSDIKTVSDAVDLLLSVSGAAV